MDPVTVTYSLLDAVAFYPRTFAAIFLGGILLIALEFRLLRPRGIRNGSITPRRRK